MAQVTCPGVVVTDATGVALCQDMAGAPLAWQEVADFHVDLVAAAQPFSVGFLLMVTCWGLGKGVALVVSLVRN